MTTLTEQLERYALASLEKQEKLAGLIGEHTVDIDYDSGMARFSGGFEFPFQVLGTESDNTLTWLWAWADEQAGIPGGLLKSALQLRTWGEQNGLREFVIPSVDLDIADGRVISLIAAGAAEAASFYREDYDGGALFLLLFGTAIDRQPAFDAAGLVRHFTELIMLGEFNHRNAILSYLRLKGLPFSDRGTAMDFELESRERMTVEFGTRGTVKKINGTELPLDL